LHLYKISYILAYINTTSWRKPVDITKWKSVLVPIEVYEEIKRMAKAEGRTISGQLRMMWEHWRKTHA